MNKAEQTIKDGTKALFFFKDITVEELIECSPEQEEELFNTYQFDRRTIRSILDGSLVTVTSLDTYTELGEKNFEYYNIKFTDLPVPPGLPPLYMTGMSGYHLDPDPSDNELYDLNSLVDDKLTLGELLCISRVSRKLSIRELFKLIAEI